MTKGYRKKDTNSRHPMDSKSPIIPTKISMHWILLFMAGFYTVCPPMIEKTDTTGTAKAEIHLISIQHLKLYLKGIYIVAIIPPSAASKQ